MNIFLNGNNISGDIHTHLRNMLAYNNIKITDRKVFTSVQKSCINYPRNCAKIIDDDFILFINA